MPHRIPLHADHHLVHAIVATMVALAGLTTFQVVAQSKAELHVSAVVQRVARLERVSQPGSVQVTQADLARGYVDATVQLVVRSNTAEGYVLAFEGDGDFFSQAHVQGLAQPLQMGPGGGLATQPAVGRGMGSTPLSLRIRLMLDGSAREGVYPFPYQITAEPA